MEMLPGQTLHHYPDRIVNGTKEVTLYFNGEYIGVSVFPKSLYDVTSYATVES